LSKRSEQIQVFDCFAFERAMVRATFGGTFPMKTKLLMMTTAALLASALTAAGQITQPGQERDRGAQTERAQPGKSEPGRNAQSNQGARDQNRPAQGTAQGKSPVTSGQAPDQQRQGQSQQQQRTQGQAAPREQERQQGQNQQRPQDRQQGQAQQRERTQGQAPREQERQQGQNQQRPQDRQQGQAQQRERTQGQAPREQERQGQTQERGNVQQGAREGERGGNASVSLTTEQRTRIRDTVLKERDAPRVGHVDFSIREGTVIPRTVHVVEIPRVILDIHPQWRGYKYFIVNDELVIVEPDTLRIVAVLPV